MIVGDAPSLTDSRVGEFLQGKTGSILKDELRIAGFNTTPYYTGIVKCSAPDGVKPEPADIKLCGRYIQDEIQANKPKFILTLGAAATKSLAKEAKITTVVGKIIERDGITYMPCFSPAYVLRDPGKLKEFKRTLRRFYELTQGRQTVEAELLVKVVDRSTLDEFKVAFEAEAEFAYDLETSGLDHYNPESFINCVGTYLPRCNVAWIIPIRKGSTLPKEAQDELIKWMASKRKRAIGHNVKFDSLWIRRKVGVYFESYFDTMLAHYMLDENSPHGLKELSRFYLDAPDYDLTLDEKLGRGVTNEKFFRYCALDCFYTYQLYRLFSKELMKDLETRNLFFELMMPMSRLYERIELVGHHVNLELMKTTQLELETSMASELKELNGLLGREINWNSTQQVGKALYGDLGLKPSVFTDKGAASTGEAALAELDHPIVKALTDYRGHQKFLSTYIEGWKEFMVGSSLFLSTKLHGTVTGRFSSRLHQVPRDGSIRNLIEAPEGWTFVQADLSQAELRIAAIVSQDPELTRCYKEGIDVHWRTAMENLRLQGTGKSIEMARDTVIKNGNSSKLTTSQVIDEMIKMGHDKAISIHKEWKEFRKQAKGINFGFLYSMGAKKFTEYAKVKYDWDLSIREADDIRNNFFSMYQMLPQWHARMKDLVKIDGFVRSIMGRKRRLPGIWSPEREVKAESERQAINSPVQGAIGDFKAMGMLSLGSNLPEEEVQILGEVHDSVLMWVRNDVLEETLPKIKYHMENPPLIKQLGVELPVPLIVDLEIGTWGKGKTWKGEAHA